jgi:CheY-like chemotaxis protein
MVLDLSLPGMSGMDLMRKMRDSTELRRIPIIVYTGRQISESDEAGLRQLAETIIVKDARSPDRLLGETALFLHRVEGSLPRAQREAIARSASSDPALMSRKILIVDDDVRNIFALTALLEQHGVRVVYAENGNEALEKLAAESDIDLVLMDIMMPVMDGYEATKRIRLRPELAKLPVIALTAKAMKGDREKCIQAGASDYITKPVDPDQLLSLLRVWLYR